MPSGVPSIPERNSMNQIKLIGELANDVSSENTEKQNPASSGANEIRLLEDLELVVIGGGDGIVVW
jgi:hypothetical protein